MGSELRPSGPCGVSHVWPSAPSAPWKVQDRLGSGSSWCFCAPRGPEFWQEQLSPGPRAAVLIGWLLAGYMNDQRHGGGQVSERGLWGQGGVLFLPRVVWLELEAASAYPSLHLRQPTSLGEPAGFLRRPEIPENALGCIQPNHNHLSAGLCGSPSSCPRWHAFPGRL